MRQTMTGFSRTVFALVMAVAVMTAFAPVIGGEAYAAAKATKPAKVKITSFAQAATMNADHTYRITAKWKLSKNAKNYKVTIKEGGTTVLTKKLGKKAKTVSYNNAAVGSEYTFTIQALNKKAKSKTSSVKRTVQDVRAKAEAVAIKADSMKAGSTLEAVVTPAEASSEMEFTWSYADDDTVLATGDSYTTQEADIGKSISVRAVLNDSLIYKDADLSATTAGEVVCRTHKYERVITEEPSKTAIGKASYVCSVCSDVDKTREEKLYYQPTAQQVYRDIMAMQTEYPEGMEWTNNDQYEWTALEGIIMKGGGCAAFAMAMSDAAFGKLTPAHKHNDLSKLKVGDILRVNEDTHSVIVLAIDGDTITIAEGNFNSSIHWGRTLSLNDLSGDSKLYIYTRYQ